MTILTKLQTKIRTELQDNKRLRFFKEFLLLLLPLSIFAGHYLAFLNQIKTIHDIRPLAVQIRMDAPNFESKANAILEHLSLNNQYCLRIVGILVLISLVFLNTRKPTKRETVVLVIVNIIGIFLNLIVVKMI